MKHRWSKSVAFCSGLLLLPACSSGPEGEGDLAKVRQPVVLINATFDSSSNGFTYVDDTFGTSQPNGASGTVSSGRLHVSLGQIFGVGAQSGGWRNSFSATGPVTGSFFYQISSSGFFEATECTEVRMMIDSTTIGSGTNPWVARVCGANGATSGTFNFTSPSLSAGSHTITIGGFLNGNTESPETSVVDIDNVVVNGTPSGCGDLACTGGETCTTCPQDCGVCSTCPNGSCSGGETCTTCPQDCGVCPTCPNGSCSSGETCTTCPQDCGVCPTCPNGSCSGGETCSTCPQDCGACPPAGDVAFIESSNQVVMEAENFTGNTPQGGHSWVSDTASSPSGGQARRSDPNNGTARNAPYTGNSPRLDYRVSFTNTGTYNVWLRGRALTTPAVGNNDSVHAGLDGVDVTSAREMNGFTSSYTWRRTRNGGNATVNVATPGIHTLNLWMREDGFVVDKIILNKSTTTPTGTGPAQSPRLNVCADGLCNGAETCTSCAQDCGACPTCPNGTCGGGETCSTCPQDCGACPTCPNGACGGGETCSTCPQDCGACPACPDGACNGTETCTSCPADCGTCPPACPDGSCNGTETCTTCPQDCGVCPPACPNGTCGAGETCTTCPQDCGACPAWGLDTRPPNPTCLAPPPLATGFALNRRWPNLTFSQPLGLVQAPGDNAWFYVLEKTGRMRAVPTNDGAVVGDTRDFLNLSGIVNAESEGGLLSAAFHPNYATNRFVYVSYTLTVGSTFTMRVSRYTSTDGGLTLNPTTKLDILSHPKTKTNHNAGNISFGPDGYLYVSLGDDAWQDPPRMLQAADPNNWFGKVLRINVNSGSPYSIPPDNPFAGGGGRPEVYAYGLRNPWRFSFDRQTGELYLADVGEDAWEEIDRIVNGGFYGWPHREADACRPGMNCSLAYRSPEFAYQHGGPLSITGGYVYRGSAIPELVGHYVYGDYITGDVWDYDLAAHLNHTIRVGGGTLSAFGEDNSGELYAIRHGSGTIEQLVRTTGGGPTDFPPLITDTGCFQPSNPTAVVSGVIPYTIALPFWSDGADKERYLALPDGTSMNIDSKGDWVLPPRGVTIKNFRWQGQLFETRFFVRHADGTYSGYTYEWNTGQTQATLVATGGKTGMLPPNVTWSYPSRSGCFACHTDVAGGSLGLETRQTNINNFYPSTGRTANQLVTLDHIGMLNGNLASMPPFPVGTDLGAPVLDRAKAYLHVNCSNCHRPGGPGRGNFDARFETLFGDMRLCNEPPTLGNLGVPGAMLVKPLDSDASVTFLRMSQRTANFMPPLASTVTDAAGAALLAEWIDGTASCPPPTVLVCNVAQNRVVNCDFVNGTTSWQLRLNGGGAGSHVVAGSQLRIDVTNPGTLDWHVQDIQVLGALTAGNYQVSFDARAASPRTIVVNLGEEGDAYTSFCQQQVSLTTTMSTYTIPCNNLPSDNNVKLDFNVGLTSTASVFLDNVYFGPPR